MARQRIKIYNTGAVDIGGVMKKQQGDVIIKRTFKIPEGATRVFRNQRGYVLAEGEATGHAHVIDDYVEMYEKDGVLYIRVDKPVTVKHEEHKPIRLESGIYKVGKVREYDPFEEEVREVKD